MTGCDEHRQARRLLRAITREAVDADTYGEPAPQAHSEQHEQSAKQLDRPRRIGPANDE